MDSKSRIRRSLGSYRGLLIFILLLAAFRTAVADWSYVPSGSMEPTLYQGDYIWIDKTAFGPSLPVVNKRLIAWGNPRRGDVITFIPPHRNDLFVKRIIAVPGDIVRFEDAAIYVNDRRLDTALYATPDGLLTGEERIDGRDHLLQLSPGRPQPHSAGDILVPAERYFVLGDHRSNSADSRAWGFVERHRIMGRVTHVAVSLSGNRPWNERLAKAVR